MKIIKMTGDMPPCCCGEPVDECECVLPPIAPYTLQMSVSNQTVPGCPEGFTLEWDGTNSSWYFHGYSGCSDQGGDFNYWVIHLRCEDNQYKLEVNYEYHLVGEQDIIKFQCVSLDPFKLTAHIVLKSLEFDAVITSA